MSSIRCPTPPPPYQAALPMLAYQGGAPLRRGSSQSYDVSFSDEIDRYNAMADNRRARLAAFCLAPCAVPCCGPWKRFVQWWGQVQP